MVERTIEDRLREEYFALLPEIQLVVEQLETEIRHRLLPILQALNPYERILVTSRVKECESAVDAMRRRQEGGIFDREQPEQYTLKNLNDLAGVRVLVFPRSRVSEIDEALRERFSSWTSDPVLGFDDEDAPVALKYHGYCDASSRVRGESQIVPMLTGLFWEIEHSTMYKPTPELKGVAENHGMQQRTQEVLDALKKFEEEFEKLLRQSSRSIQRST
jgi:ppGpp synthetase/RelA/SpoT-type nucleotidyltranferase